eukprot:GHVP01054322.1.p1 GENE.GHVP01054322.1~~GHVP01054322.1.p1  ORF type:complete len:158 (+),score=27.83 GHVP01054322.1:43-516(+)
MEFFKNVSDELANMFIGHQNVFEKEDQQGGLNFHADAEEEDDGKAPKDLEIRLAKICYTVCFIGYLMDLLVKDQTIPEFVRCTKSNTSIVVEYTYSRQIPVTNPLKWERTFEQATKKAKDGRTFMEVFEELESSVEKLRAVRAEETETETGTGAEPF